jgi:hypothetical protein
MKIDVNIGSKVSTKVMNKYHYVGIQWNSTVLPVDFKKFFDSLKI